MRVIAGRLGGQIFDSPDGHRTHPMSDKIRGALFNSLGDIKGLNVLDAFSGSGALAIEAISRGAKTVVAIDNDRNAQATLMANIRKLNLGHTINLVKANAGSWLKTTDLQFDIVLCDPPYNQMQLELVEKLAPRTIVGGVFVVSLPPKARLLLTDNFMRLSYKQYGDAELHFYRRLI